MSTINILEPESYSANMTPQGDIGLLGVPQIQPSETYLGNYQIKSENKERELWFLQHHFHPLDDKDTIKK